jgi:AraC-like DNA-binding protein
MSTPLPVQTFRSAQFAPASQFRVWQDCISPMFDAEAPSHAANGFFAEYEAYLAGPLVIGSTAFDAHVYGRGAERVRRDGANHFHINLHLSGGYTIQAGTCETIAYPGDITLLDFTRPLLARSSRSELLVIAIPRDMMGEEFCAADYHGRVLRNESALGGMLGDYMRSLAMRLPSMTVSEASAIAPVTIAMIATCFRADASGLGADLQGNSAALYKRVRRHIDENLSAAAMSAEDICRDLSISRSALYRLLEPHGGVARFIWNQRLSRAFTTLMTPSESHRQISDIAFDWGFKSEAHFSRAFRNAFGLTPRDAQSMAFAEPGHRVRIDAGQSASAESGEAASLLRELLSAVRRL